MESFLNIFSTNLAHSFGVNPFTDFLTYGPNPAPKLGTADLIVVGLVAIAGLHFVGRPSLTASDYWAALSVA